MGKSATVRFAVWMLTGVLALCAWACLGGQQTYAATGLVAGGQESQAAAAQSALSAQAKKTNVWVIVKDTVNYHSEGVKVAGSMSYAKTGLLKTHKDGNGNTFTYSYDGKNRLKSCKMKYNGKLDRTVTYKLNSKGWVTKATHKYARSKTKMTTSYKYDSKGRLARYMGYYAATKYAYDKNGRVKTMSYPVSDDGSQMGTAKYTYDAKGSLASEKLDGEKPSTYVSTYKSGRLVKQVKYDADGKKTETRTIAYKKVSVPTSVAKMVKAQQATLKVRYLYGETLPIEAAHK